MARAPRCTICGRSFRPEPRSRHHQRTCSKGCRKKARRERDREHKRLYRDTGLGREQRRRESEKRRERLGWADYMRYWRKADAVRSVRIDREAARIYYRRHREAIVEKRRQQRAARKALQKARSQ